jgi:hypothetical protein
MQIHQVLLLMKYVIDEGYGVDTTNNAQISNSRPYGKGVASGRSGTGVDKVASASQNSEASQWLYANSGRLVYTPQTARHMAGKSAEKKKGKKCISNFVGSM